MVSEREIPLPIENVRIGLSAFLQQIRLKPTSDYAIHKGVDKVALKNVPENDRATLRSSESALENSGSHAAGCSACTTHSDEEQTHFGVSYR